MACPINTWLNPRAACTVEIVMNPTGPEKPVSTLPEDTFATTLAVRSRKLDRLMLAVLLVVAALILTRDVTVGGPRHGDSAVHAMDGVLILDWLRAGPDAWREPMAFAERQYAHYPALGIGTHYPPGYAIVEAACFALFGVSVETARLCVASFGLLLVAGVFVLVRRWWDTAAAALACATLLAMPAVTTWGRQIMLEIPTLAVLTWSAIALGHYADRPTGRRLAIALIGATLCPLFKQPAVFFLVAMAAWSAWEAFRKRIAVGHAVTVSAAAVTVLTIIVVSLDGHGSQLLRGDATFEHPWSWRSLSFYARILPGLTSWPLAAAGVAGLILWLRRAPVSRRWIPLLWFAACYGLLTCADYKNPRFFTFALVPVALWTGIALRELAGLLRPIALRSAAITAAIAGCAIFAATRPVELRPDYGPVVAAHAEEMRGRLVLFSGLRDGDFVFAARCHLPKQATIVARSSKLLYTCNGRTNLDFRSLVTAPEDVARLVERFGFALVFVERENKLDLREEEWLRNYASSASHYELAASYSLRPEEVPSSRDVTMDVYRSTRPPKDQPPYLEVPIPRTGRTVRLTLGSP